MFVVTTWGDACEWFENLQEAGFFASFINAVSFAF